MRFQSGTRTLRGLWSATWKGTKGAQTFTSTRNPEQFDNILTNTCVLDSNTACRTEKAPKWINNWNSETNPQDLQGILNDLEASLALDHEEDYDRFYGDSELPITDVDDYIPLDRPVDIRAEFDDDTSDDDVMASKV
jgi:hypothetical protein